MQTPGPPRPLDLGPYAGRWVALIDGRVAGAGRTPLEARRAAEPGRGARQPEVAYVTGAPSPHLRRELPLSPVMASVRQVLRQQADVPIYLVGGAVRDALLGKMNKDLDLAVQGDAVELARSVADAFHGAFYVLDAERGTARVVLQNHPLASTTDPIILDFAQLRGAELEADLRDRDFTINAMALPALAESPTPETVIDPLDGQADLADRLVRAVSGDAIKSDPVRSLRAVRHAAALGGEIAPETIDQITAAAPLLTQVSAERIRDELIRLLESPQPADSVRSLSRLGLLEQVLPEVEATRGVTQSPPHTLDVFEHTLRALEQLETLLAALSGHGTRSSAALVSAHDALVRVSHHLADHLSRMTAGGRTRRAILLLATLLHDIGKPRVRSVEESGRIRFLRHEHVGAEMAAERARSLALSVGEVRMIGTVIRHHMRPAWLAPAPSGRAIYRFFRDTKEAGVETCLLSLGDGLGRGEDLDLREWDELTTGVAILLESYFERFGESISPPALLTGRELMDTLHIPPGPEVGRLLELIRESQAAGEVSTRAGALLLAQEAHKAR